MVVAGRVIYDPAYIFVHVPKTGGTSVCNALGRSTRKEFPAHTPLRCVEKGNRFAFGFVRNPWVRMVSLYRFMCQKEFKRTDNFDQEHVRKMGFKRWLMDDRFIMQEDTLPGGEPWVMRTHWTGDGGTELPPMQRRPQLWWLKGCDFIGRTETLAADLAEVVARLDIKANEVGRNNTTKGGDWREEYDAETRAFIAEHFRPDIATFGYAFE